MELKIAEDIYYVGSYSKDQNQFEGALPIPNGMNYNSYLIMDEKTCLVDTVDVHVKEQFIKNVTEVLNGKKLDYLIVQHLEPDHTSAILDLMKMFPLMEVKISPMGFKFLKQFFVIEDKDLSRFEMSSENETLTIGKHVLKFIGAPMVHWPEVMLSFDTYTGTLFSADGFGSFGAYVDKIFADLYDFNKDLLDENRRYYTNIVGKYGIQVNNLLNKVSSLNIKIISPLHGVIFRKDLLEIISKYKLWASYKEEKQGVLIVYSTVYGHTKFVASLIENKLKDASINVESICLNTNDVSYAISLSFVYKYIILCSTTFNMGLYTKMENYLYDFIEHQISNKKFYFVENGTWAPQAAGIMKQILMKTSGNQYSSNVLTIRSSFKCENSDSLNNLINEVKADVFLG